MSNDKNNAYRERTPLGGTVDFTMMYVAHDALARDLQRLGGTRRDPGHGATAAASTGQTALPPKLGSEVRAHRALEHARAHLRPRGNRADDGRDPNG